VVRCALSLSKCGADAFDKLRAHRQIRRSVSDQALPHHDADQLGCADDHLGYIAAGQRAYHRFVGQNY
jgi:hypothetical protein